MTTVRLFALVLLLAAAGCAAGGGNDDDGGFAGDTSGVTTSGNGSTGQGGDPSGPSSSSQGGASTNSAQSGVGGSGGSGSTSAAGGSGGATTAASSNASSGTGGSSNDIWLEIDYSSSSSTPTTPGWSFSPTPNWGAAEWATQGNTWPEAWDPLQGMHVQWDNLGSYALIIGSSEHLQLMVGLQSLQSYQEAVVRIEGRGYSSNATAHFDVYNPLNNCGVSTSISHSWQLHIVEVSLGQCMVPGGGVQAIRVDPTSQGVALVRMKLTIKGAVY